MECVFLTSRILKIHLNYAGNLLNTFSQVFNPDIYFYEFVPFLWLYNS